MRKESFLEEALRSRVEQRENLALEVVVVQTSPRTGHAPFAEKDVTRAEGVLLKKTESCLAFVERNGRSLERKGTKSCFSGLF